MKQPTDVLKKYRNWVMALAVVGIGLASYLYYEYATQGLYGVCNINSVVNCAPVITGELALFMGIPVSVIGGVGYLAILLLTFFKRYRWAFGMAVFGMAFCLRLTILEVFFEKVLCPVCLLCQVIMLILFFLLYQMGWPEKVGLVKKEEA